MKLAVLFLSILLCACSSVEKEEQSHTLLLLEIKAPDQHEETESFWVTEKECEEFFNLSIGQVGFEERHYITSIECKKY